MTTAASTAAVEHLIGATREVFETMLNASPAFGLPTDGGGLRPRANVVATVSFAGPECGVVGFYASLAAAGQIASGLPGRPAQTPDEIADAIGEIANMIAGCFRNHLAADGAGWAISIPSVTMGSDFYTRYGSDVRRVLCPFRIWGDDVFVELVLTKGPHGHRH